MRSASAGRISANLMGRRLQLDQHNAPPQAVHLKICSIAEVALRYDRPFSGPVTRGPAYQRRDGRRCEIETYTRLMRQTEKDLWPMLKRRIARVVVVSHHCRE